MSPFSHSSDVREVVRLEEHGRNRKPTEADRGPSGATVVLNAVPNLTEEWLERVVECHLARNAALGHEVPEMPYCPLVPKDVRATVRAVDGGFAVDIESNDAEVAEEIWRRAQLIKQ